MQKTLLMFLCIVPAWCMAQTITDGMMMKKGDLCTGFMGSHDQWTKYWEGERNRENGNIGSVKTQSIAWGAAYGLTNKLNLIAMLPYMQTEATQGVLHGQSGLQDLTLAVKYNFFQKEYAKSVLKTFAGLAFSTPVGDYTRDFFPLSLGTGTTNLSWRATANYKFLERFYVNGSSAYTWRSNTTLDRSSYYTEGELHMTNEVRMPNVFDYTVSFGYQNGPLMADLAYLQQNTLGGADIRRQDMPFVSNRMNFSKVALNGMYTFKKPYGLVVKAGIATTVDGRNVGQSNTYMAGILYTLHFGTEVTESK